MSKVAKTTISLMIVTLLAKVLGFIREIVLASAYGVGGYTDAYLTAMNIPMVIFSTIGTAIATTFIPLYYENNKNGGETKSILFTNNVINIVNIISVFIIIFILVFTEPVVKLFAFGFEGEQLKLTAQLTRIMIFSIPFIGMSNIMKSYLNIKDNFIVPGLISLPFNIFIIISIVLSIRTNIYILGIGTLIAMCSQFLFQLPYSIRNGYKYSKYININDESVKKMVCLVGPVFIGVAVNQLNSMIDRTLASTLVEGSISALNYANRLNQFVIGMFIVSITSVIYPMLSKLSIDNDKDGFIRTVCTSINSVVLLVMPVTVGAIVLANPIVKILFQRGEFNETATKMTSIALIFYSIGLVSFGLRDVFGKVFYSLKDTRTPMINGAIAMVINIILNFILVRLMGHAGLAFATSLSGILTIILLFISLKKKIGYFGQDRIIKVVVKSLLASAAMGGITAYIYKSISISTSIEIVALLIAILAGVIVYSVLIIILKVDEINILIKKYKSKLSI